MLDFDRLPMGSVQWDEIFHQDDYKAQVKGMYDRSVIVFNDTTAMPEHTITVNEYGDTPRYVPLPKRHAAGCLIDSFTHSKLYK